MHVCVDTMLESGIRISEVIWYLGYMLHSSGTDHVEGGLETGHASPCSHCRFLWRWSCWAIYSLWIQLVSVLEAELSSALLGNWKTLISRYIGEHWGHYKLSIAWTKVLSAGQFRCQCVCLPTWKWIWTRQVDTSTCDCKALIPTLKYTLLSLLMEEGTGMPVEWSRISEMCIKAYLANSCLPLALQRYSHRVFMTKRKESYSGDCVKPKSTFWFQQEAIHREPGWPKESGGEKTGLHSYYMHWDWAKIWWNPRVSITASWTAGVYGLLFISHLYIGSAWIYRADV